MLQSEALIKKAQDIRQGLRYPPNAVPDRPIKIERVRGITGYEAQRLAAQKVLDDLQKQIDAKVALLRELSDKIEGARPVATTPIAPSAPVSIKEIQLEVSRQWNVDILDIMSRRRTAEVVVPRQIAMVIAKKLTKSSLPEIGRRFGNRDHTTVIHALEKYHWLAAALDPHKMRGMSLEQWVSTAKQLVLTRDAKNG